MASSKQETEKASLLTLPVELRRQIFSCCVYDHWDYYSGTGLHWHDPASTLRWQKDENDFEWGLNGRYYYDIRDPPPELLQAMPDREVKALAMPNRSTKCNILYVCRQLYSEAIVLFYELNKFHFWDARLMADFSDATFAMGNVQFITSLSIVVDLWDNSKDANNWKSWQEFFEGGENRHRLLWHFPGLESLEIDFEPSSRSKAPWGYFYVDGTPWDRYRRHLNQRPRSRQEGFDSFADTLRRTVKVEEVRTFHLHDGDLQTALEQEMMGRGVDSGSWIPKNVYDPAVPSTPIEEWVWEGENGTEDEAEGGEVAGNEAVGDEAWE